MKLLVTKYKPNFVDTDLIQETIELKGDYEIAHATSLVQQRVPWLYKHYSKFKYKFVTFGHVMLMLHDRPYANIRIIEL